MTEENAQENETNVVVDIECKSCKGTGIYVGMAERGGAGVICIRCNGTGKDILTYKPFVSKKIRNDIIRVYKSGSPYIIAPKELTFDKGSKDEITIDMNKKGVSYEEWLEGKQPDYIEELGCPMLQAQDSCHRKQGFIDKCNEHLRWGSNITRCANKNNMKVCWDMFKEL